MDKFSKLNPNKHTTFGDSDKEILYKDEYLKVIKYDGYNIVKEKDCVFCILYLIEQNKFIIRQEYIPTYKYVDGQDYHISLVGGQIDKGEDVETALLREIQEEAGIVIRENFEIQIDKPLFTSKGNSSKYYTSIITLTENDYHEVTINDPDNKNKRIKSSAVKVDIKFIKSLQCSDIPTQYMINKFKEYLNL